MDFLPTNQLNQLEKRKVDKLLEEKLRKPASRKEFRKRVDACIVLEEMRNTVPDHTVQKIQQTQQNNGKEAAASKFLDEVCRYDCWATALLDALHYNNLSSFAKKLYRGYVPPNEHDSDVPTSSSDDEGQHPQGSPPPYPEGARNCRSSEEPIISQNSSCVTQNSVERIVPVTYPAASQPSLHQDNCAEQSDNMARSGHEAGDLELNTVTGPQLDNPQASRIFPAMVSGNAPDSALPVDNDRSDGSSTKLLKEQALNFDLINCSSVEYNTSTLDTVAASTLETNQTDKETEQKLGSSAEQIHDDGSIPWCRVDEIISVPPRQTSNYSYSKIGASASLQPVTHILKQSIDGRAATSNVSEKHSQEPTEQSMTVDQSAQQSSHETIVHKVKRSSGELEENEHNAVSDNVENVPSSSNVQHEQLVESPTLCNVMQNKPIQKSGLDCVADDENLANLSTTTPLDAGNNDTRCAVEEDTSDLPLNDETTSNHNNHVVNQSQNKPQVKNTDKQTITAENSNPKPLEDQSYVTSSSHHLTKASVGVSGKKLQVGDCVVNIPAGALDKDVALELSCCSEGYKELEAITPILNCKPHGLKFLKDVEIILPTWSVTDGRTSVIAVARQSTDEAGDEWEDIVEFDHSIERDFSFTVQTFSLKAVFVKDKNKNLEIVKSLICAIRLPLSPEAQSMILHCYIDDDVSSREISRDLYKVFGEVNFNIRRKVVNIDLKLSNDDIKFDPENAGIAEVWRHRRSERSFKLFRKETSLSEQKITILVNNNEIGYFFLPRQGSPPASEQPEIQFSDFSPSRKSSELSLHSDAGYQIEQFQPIHEGLVASVYFSKGREGAWFAAKRQWNLNRYQHELDLVKELKHENIVQYHATLPSNNDIVLELCNATVEQFVNAEHHYIDLNNGKYVREDIRKQLPITPLSILEQSAKGVAYLHDQYPAIVHLDIHPSNFLLKKVGTAVLVKVTDFDSSKKLRTVQPLRPPRYQSFAAPELYRNNCDTSSDIFSLAIYGFYVLTLGKHPFGEDHEHRYNICGARPPKLNALKLEVFHAETPPSDATLPENDRLSREQRISACDLFKRMLQFDPKKRLAIHDVLRHPTFWNAGKKVEFYKDVQKFIEARESQVIDAMNLDDYDLDLLDDEEDGLEKMPISSKSIPAACRNTKKFPVRFDETKPVVKQLIKAIRNKASHSNLTQDEKTSLFAASDQASEKNQWDMFYVAFTNDLPQLLVHTYEKFRKLEISDKTKYY